MRVARIALVACMLALVLTPAFSQRARAQTIGGSDVRLVIVLTRHGVRTPTHPQELARYARQPWPKPPVAPGYLTERGTLLMRQFGQSYREQFASEGLVSSTGCPASGSVYVWADVDQRTRATAAALLSGFAPNCGIAAHAAQGDSDPLFDPVPALGSIDAATSHASLVGSIGADPAALNTAYRAQFALLDTVLGCGPGNVCKPISQVPTTVKPSGDGGQAALEGGFDLAATAAENLLLEYTDGARDAGWGRLDRDRLLQVLQIHNAKSRMQNQNPYAARAHGSNLMLHVLQTLQQGATGTKVPGTAVPANSRVAFIVGHDTNLDSVAGLLRLSWLIDGYNFNETPPGGALVFELHAPAHPAPAFVRTFFTAQSIDDMRDARGTHPSRVPVYVPGCPSLDCPLSTFAQIVNGAIDPAFTAPWT